MIEFEIYVRTGISNVYEYNYILCIKKGYCKINVYFTATLNS
jgi:hypothetical protein